MTLPENLINKIKALVQAHREFSAVIEELAALDASMLADLDKLVPRQEKLADLSLVGKAPVQLPRAIVPVMREPSGQPSDQVRGVGDGAA